ncbi:plasmid replication DNA-binding protein, partial [Acinetobacter johnsonii]
PIRKQDVKESVKVDSPNSAEVLLLRQQIDILKNQLDDAKDRESFYQNQIETMQRLLEAPKPHIPTSVDPDPTQAEPMTEEKEEVIAMPQKELDATENKRIPVPEQVEQEPEKRGFWSRFFRPYD